MMKNNMLRFVRNNNKTKTITRSYHKHLKEHNRYKGLCQAMSRTTFSEVPLDKELNYLTSLIDMSVKHKLAHDLLKAINKKKINLKKIDKDLIKFIIQHKSLASKRSYKKFNRLVKQVEPI